MHEETDGLGDREIETHTLFKFNGHFTPFSNWREKWRFAMLIFAFQLFDIFRWSRRIANRGVIERWHGRGMDHSTTAMLVISHIHRIFHSAPLNMSDLSKWTFYCSWVQLESVAFVSVLFYEMFSPVLNCVLYYDAQCGHDQCYLSNPFQTIRLLFNRPIVHLQSKTALRRSETKVTLRCRDYGGLRHQRSIPSRDTSLVL